MSPPGPESTARRTVLHAVGVGAILTTLVYLVWRIGWRIAVGEVLWLGIPSSSSSRVDRTRERLRSPARFGAQPGVTVVIATYDERLEVLLPIVTDVLAMDGGQETWILDAGDRPRSPRWLGHRRPLRHRRATSTPP